MTLLRAVIIFIFELYKYTYITTNHSLTSNQDKKDSEIEKKITKREKMIKKEEIKREKIIKKEEIKKEKREMR